MNLQLKQNLHASPTRITDFCTLLINQNRPGKTEFTCITYKSHNLIRFWYTNRPGAHECVVYSTILCIYVYTAAVCAGADPTGVGGVYSSLCRELHVQCISFTVFATYFSMPISVF